MKTGDLIAVGTQLVLVLEASADWRSLKIMRPDGSVAWVPMSWCNPAKAVV